MKHWKTGEDIGSGWVYGKAHHKKITYIPNDDNFKLT